jgi:hypothetical protein
VEWQIVIAFIIAAPIILFPVAFTWYLNMGGIYTAVKEARAKRALREKENKLAVG